MRVAFFACRRVLIVLPWRKGERMNTVDKAPTKGNEVTVEVVTRVGRWYHPGHFTIF